MKGKLGLLSMVAFGLSALFSFVSTATDKKDLENHIDEEIERRMAAKAEEKSEEE